MKYLPTMVIEKFNQIDFDKLYSENKKIILTDLDNTLIDYTVKEPTEELINLNQKLREKGFKIYIISNNSKKRIEKFTKNFKVDGYLPKALKPWKIKLNKYLKKNNINKEETIFIGDQLLTDIKAANNVNLDSILVCSINRKSEKWYTTINRLREGRILKKIKKLNPEIYEKIERIRNNE